MIGSHGRPHGGRHLRHVGPPVATGKLICDNQLLGAVNGHGEGRAHTRFQRLMAVAHGLLNVLRIMIATVDDNQIFDPAGNV